MIPTSKEHRIPVIYQITNRQSGKVYVGRSVNFYCRYKVYRKAALGRLKRDRNMPINKALLKYGIENFDFTILEHVTDTSTIRDREQVWLDKLQPFAPNGYNICKSSIGPVGHKYSKEEKDIINHLKKNTVYQIDPISLKVIGEYPCPQDATEAIGKGGKRGNISGACKHRWRAYGFFWCYKEDYDKSGFTPQQDKYRYNPAWPILQFNLDGEYIKEWPSTTECSKSIGVHSYQIAQCCLGRGHTAGDSLWCFKHVYEQTKQPPKLTRKKLKRKVLQKDLSGRPIQTWNSLTSAAKSIGMTASAIYACCHGRLLTCCGYKWEYVD